MATEALTSPSVQEPRRTKQQQCFPPFVAASFCGAFVFAGLGVWFVSAALRLSRERMSKPPTKSVRCLTSALTEVANYIDTESDPCTDFHELACNKSGYTPASAAIRLKFTKDFIDPILQGRFKDQKSRLLSVHYSACVETAATGHVNIEEATRNMMKMFRSASELGNGSDIIKLIGILSVQFGLYMPVHTYAAVDDESGNAYIAIAPPVRRSIPNFFTNSKLRPIVERFVRALKSQPQGNITIETLREFDDLTKSLLKEYDRGILEGSLSVLDAVTPTISLSVWKPYLLRAFNSWTGNVQAENESLNIKIMVPTKIGKLLELYVVAEQRPQAVGYLALWSLYQFFLEEIELDANAKSPAERAAMCSKMIRNYHFVWASIAVDRIKQPKLDVLIVELYKSVVDSVLTETKTILDVVRRRNMSLLDYQAMMSDFKLVLPHELTSVYSQQLPRLTRDYWANMFLMRRHQRTAAMADRARGLSGPYSQEWDMFAHPVVIYKRNVIFSPTVYSMLHADCRDEKERRLLDALTIGVTVADQLIGWMYNRIWSSSRAGDGEFRKWLLCHRQPADAAHSQEPMIFYPWLALRVALRMAHLDWWDDVFMHWTTWTLRPAQIFYGLFYTRHMCGRVIGTAMWNTTSLRMHGVPGFSEAFQCRPMGISSRDLCIVATAIL